MFSLGMTETKRSDSFPTFYALIFTYNYIFPVTRS